MVSARGAYRWTQQKNNRILPAIVGSAQCERAWEANDTLFHWLRVIEALVAFVLTDGEAKLQFGTSGLARWWLQDGPLLSHFRFIGKFSLGLIPRNCTYSCHVDLFLACWSKCCGLGEHSCLADYAILRKKVPHELFNELIEEIRCAAGEPRYKKAVRTRHAEAVKNCRTAEEYASALYATYPYLRTFIVDFFYDANPERPSTIAEIKKDLYRLVNNRRRKGSLFERHVGYVWSLQWFATVGWCVSVVFFYADAYGIDEGGIAEKVGSYWRVEITKGRGRYAVAQSWPHSIYPQIQLTEMQAKARGQVLQEIRNTIFSRLYAPIPLIETSSKHIRWFGRGGRAHGEG
jgi:hypothetical protein